MLVSGSSVDYTDGYVGCMRALMVNGVMIDLRGMVDSRKVTYGVSAGQSSLPSPCIDPSPTGQLDNIRVASDTTDPHNNQVEMSSSERCTGGR